MKSLVILFLTTLMFISCETKKKDSYDENAVLEKYREDRKKSDEELIQRLLKEQKAVTWKVGDYNDDFGDPTGEHFISTNVGGNFSNSATSRADLYAEVRIDKGSAGIFLHERRPSSPAVKPIGSMVIRLKNEKGKTIQIMTSQAWNTSGGISISDANMRYKFVKFIKGSVGDIKAVVKNSYSSTYRFDFSANGFTKAYNQL